MRCSRATSNGNLIEVDFLMLPLRQSLSVKQLCVSKCGSEAHEDLMHVTKSSLSFFFKYLLAYPKYRIYLRCHVFQLQELDS